MKDLQTTAPHRLKPTLPAYAPDIKIFNKWLDGRRVTPETLTAFFDEMKDTRRGATLQRYRASIKKSLEKHLGNNITLAERYALEQFFKGLKPARRDPAVTDDRILHRDELMTIFAIAPPRASVLIRALYETAARVSELLNVRLDDCEPTPRGVVVTIRRGKGGRERTVYLRSITFDKIREAFPGGPYLFDNGSGRPIRRESAFKMVAAAGRRIGRKISPHLIRHSWASAHVNEGLAETSAYLGHSTVGTTTRFYIHGRPSMGDILAFNERTTGGA